MLRVSMYCLLTLSTFGAAAQTLESDDPILQRCMNLRNEVEGSSTTIHPESILPCVEEQEAASNELEALYWGETIFPEEYDACIELASDDLGPDWVRALECANAKIEADPPG